MVGKQNLRSWAVALGLLLLGSDSVVDAAACGKKPIIRKEWRTLTSTEKSSYLSAVNCLLSAKTAPALTPPLPDGSTSGVLSRYDDLSYTHVLQTMSVHFVGHFLPWHRLYVATYESMLRNECGYKGAQPYWDWTLDAESPEKWVSSPVFDPETGFGGNGDWVENDPTSWFPPVPGRTGGGCVRDGPWAGKEDVVHMGPGESTALNNQCLKRDLSPAFAARFVSWNQTRHTLGQGTYEEFTGAVEGKTNFDESGVHGGGHYGVGGNFGQMGDLHQSPADPIFYLHHANLDRLWWSWQKLNLTTRLKEISGPSVMMQPTSPPVTLDFPMTLGVSYEEATVGDVMNIMGCGKDGVLCYDYDKLYTL
ncbi:hypothetical protein B0T20DRAFT_509127 [Sordaria brevicollis]|uniref:Tyrosinase copper-binding domain-containing protein n=1 Tax=Sordaria brevicollis TaxID=83679 RepID=A0AAE0P8L7_SORBR|nr:hypothetical protein B0T20DRAFT_509127 [Sordaria brevicollis]